MLLMDLRRWLDQVELGVRSEPLGVRTEMERTVLRELEGRILAWMNKLPDAIVLPVSALHGFGQDSLLNHILTLLPESPAYFPKDELTDKSMRFFISEIVREKILRYCHKEVPYSSEVTVESYKEEENIVRIRAEIIVSRETQKAIIIGHQGSMLKRIGMAARKDIEEFIQRHVFLELHVKVDEDWRDDERKLRKYGYLS
jgi:GTP-binding protein Era